MKENLVLLEGYMALSRRGAGARQLGSYFRGERCELVYRSGNFFDRGRDFVEVLFGRVCFGVRRVQCRSSVFIFG